MVYTHSQIKGIPSLLVKGMGEGGGNAGREGESSWCHMYPTGSAHWTQVLEAPPTKFLIKLKFIHDKVNMTL